MSKKYPQLDDAEWLYQKYRVEELSIRQISAIVGCVYSTVFCALKGFDICIRTKSEAHERGSEYWQLNDRDWLYQKYVIDELSTCKIADIVGCSYSAVRDALRRLNIHVRTYSEVTKGEKNPNYGNHYTKETKRNMSNARKKLYQNHDFAKRMFKATAKRPTKPEKIFQVIVDNNTLSFKYTGDGKVVIGNKCPDFMHLTKKIVVEVFGHAFHSPLFTFKKKMPYHQTYEGTIKHYKKHGYKCVIFWDRDLVERKDAEAFVLSALEGMGII